MSRKPISQTEILSIIKCTTKLQVHKTSKENSWRIYDLVFLLCSNSKLNGKRLICSAGNVVKPDNTSASFLSFLGYWDKRVQLDSSIERGDGKYNAALSMMASKASYENEAYIEAIVKDHWNVWIKVYIFT